ncbi:MAG: FecR domain-containing protein [Lachnospiraceae bacterium]|nr:FecR domain-containing protein [Lachnospiraceae bacterium]
MNIGDFLKTTKGKIISVGGVSVVAIGIAAAVLLQGEGFRSIAVQELAGSVTVVGTENNGQAYVGEHLYSGDDVTVGDASELTMCMDNDKYVYADSNTHFLLEASAADDDSRIKITLDAGSELNVLETHLEANETYEVDTPNSTMSVRGTTFRVTVYTAADGMVYTLTEVSDGTVKARLKTKDGTYNGVEQDFTAGQSALIRGNEAFSEFVTSGMLDTSNLDMGDMDESELLLLAYGELPQDGMERLIELLEQNNFIEETEAEPEEPEVTPTPSATPTPEVEPEEEVAPTAEVTPALTIYDRTYNEWVTGRDPETGGYILRDGTIFDPVYYAQHNPDVVAMYGNNPKALLYHWLTLGRDENRAPSEHAAQAQDEAFLKFAKMLDDAYAEEMRQKEASASEDNSTGGGTGGWVYANVLAANSAGTYDPTTHFGTIGNVNFNTFSAVPLNQNNTGWTNVTTNQVLTPDVSITLPVQMNAPATTGYGNEYINYPAWIDWGGSATPLSVTGSDGSVTTVTEVNGVRTYNYSGNGSGHADLTNYTDSKAFQTAMIEYYPTP